MNMLLRIIKETFLRRKKWVALVFVSVLMGASLTSALLTVYGDITSKMSQELRSYGANILVRPRSSGLELEIGGISYTPPSARVFLDEKELPKIKTIFWKYNIVGFAPFLSVLAQMDGNPVVLTGTWFERTFSIPDLAPKQFGGKAPLAREESTFTTGVRKIMPWWQLEGDWVSEGDSEGAVVGVEVAKRMGIALGDRFALNYEGKPINLRAIGIVATGSFEDNQVFVNLPVVQQLMGISYGVDKVLVSALVTPENKISPAIRGKNPGQMTPEEYEIWYCTPLVESIAFQIEEVISEVDANPIRQIAEAESSFVGKTELLVFLITGVALTASALGVATAMNTMILERRREIGLMKAIGAHDSQVATIFFLEAGIIGLAGGLVGYLGGLGLAQYIGREVFGMSFSFSGIAFPVTLLLAIAIALVGSFLPVRQAIKTEPVTLLREV
ncbi:MAG: ABC transporter permease [Actinobacteria bacterium]|nr:ABC transporter permease [Actinomycetota bacterium]